MRFATFFAASCGLVLTLNSLVMAQVRTSDAALVVEGTVERVYEQSGADQNLLVQILVQRSENLTTNRPQHDRWPAPGEFLFVALERGMARPNEGDTIEGRLAPSVDGGWTGASRQWFTGSDDSSARSTDRLPESDRRQGNDQRAGSDTAVVSIPTLGLQGERIDVQGALAIRVTQMAAEGAAKAAGLEIGDIIIGIDGQKLSTESLANAGRQLNEFELNVIDVNSGRVARVNVQPQVAVAADDSETRSDVDSNRPRTAPPAYSLGLSAEETAVDGRPALKIVRIQPDSAAARAGLEKGDVLVKIDGKPIGNIESLVTALRNSNGRITLSVRDVRTGREVPVDVDLRGTESSAGGSSPLGNPRGNQDDRRGSDTVTRPDSGRSQDGNSRQDGGQAVGGLGISTDIAFNDNEVAVKITDVVRGGAGDRAGLVRGMLIVAANGKPVLHPNDLKAAEQAGGPLELTVVDADTGRQRRITLRPR